MAGVLTSKISRQTPFLVRFFSIKHTLYRLKQHCSNQSGWSNIAPLRLTRPDTPAYSYHPIHPTISEFVRQAF